MLRLGIDIGGTKINLGIIREKDGKVEVLTSVRLETRALDDIVTGIADAAKDICKNNKIHTEGSAVSILRYTTIAVYIVISLKPPCKRN